MAKQDQYKTPRRVSRPAPIEPDRRVIDRLVDAQQAMRAFSGSFGRGDVLDDLDQARQLTEATKNLEDTVWVVLNDTDLTMQEIADHNGSSRQGAHRHLKDATRRVSAEADRPFGTDQRSGLDGPSPPGRVIDRLVDAQQAMQALSVLFGRGDVLDDLDRVLHLAGAIKNLEDTAWVALKDAGLTVQEIADHDGRARQTIDRHIKDATRRVSAEADRPFGTDQRSGLDGPAPPELAMDL